MDFKPVDQPVSRASDSIPIAQPASPPPEQTEAQARTVDIAKNVTNPTSPSGSSLVRTFKAIFGRDIPPAQESRVRRTATVGLQSLGHQTDPVSAMQRRLKSGKEDPALLLYDADKEISELERNDSSNLVLRTKWTKFRDDLKPKVTSKMGFFERRAFIRACKGGPIAPTIITKLLATSVYGDDSTEREDARVLVGKLAQARPAEFRQVVMQSKHPLVQDFVNEQRKLLQDKLTAALTDEKRPLPENLDSAANLSQGYRWLAASAKEVEDWLYWGGDVENIDPSLHIVATLSHDELLPIEQQMIIKTLNGMTSDNQEDYALFHKGATFNMMGGAGTDKVRLGEALLYLQSFDTDLTRVFSITEALKRERLGTPVNPPPSIIDALEIMNQMDDMRQAFIKAGMTEAQLPLPAEMISAINELKLHVRDGLVGSYQIQSLSDAGLSPSDDEDRYANALVGFHERYGGYISTDIDDLRQLEQAFKKNSTDPVVLLGKLTQYIERMRAISTNDRDFTVQKSEAVKRAVEMQRSLAAKVSNMSFSETRAYKNALKSEALPADVLKKQVVIATYGNKNQKAEAAVRIAALVKKHPDDSNIAAQRAFAIEDLRNAVESIPAIRREISGDPIELTHQYQSMDAMKKSLEKAQQAQVALNMWKTDQVVFDLEMRLNKLDMQYKDAQFQLLQVPMNNREIALVEAVIAKQIIGQALAPKEQAYLHAKAQFLYGSLMPDDQALGRALDFLTENMSEKFAKAIHLAASNDRDDLTEVLTILNRTYSLRVILEKNGVPADEIPVFEQLNPVIASMKTRLPELQGRVTEHQTAIYFNLHRDTAADRNFSRAVTDFAVRYVPPPFGRQIQDTRLDQLFMQILTVGESTYQVAWKNKEGLVVQPYTPSQREVDAAREGRAQPWDPSRGQVGVAYGETRTITYEELSNPRIAVAITRQDGRVLRKDAVLHYGESGPNTVSGRLRERISGLDADEVFIQASDPANPLQIKFVNGVAHRVLENGESSPISDEEIDEVTPGFLVTLKGSSPAFFISNILDRRRDFEEALQNKATDASVLLHDVSTYLDELESLPNDDPVFNREMSAVKVRCQQLKEDLTAKIAHWSKSETRAYQRALQTGDVSPTLVTKLVAMLFDGPPDSATLAEERIEALLKEHNAAFKQAIASSNSAMVKEFYEGIEGGGAELVKMANSIPPFPADPGSLDNLIGQYAWVEHMSELRKLHGFLELWSNDRVAMPQKAREANPQFDTRVQPLLTNQLQPFELALIQKRLIGDAPTDQETQYLKLKAKVFLDNSSRTSPEVASLGRSIQAIHQNLDAWKERADTLTQAMKASRESHVSNPDELANFIEAEQLYFNIVDTYGKLMQRGVPQAQIPFYALESGIAELRLVFWNNRLSAGVVQGLYDVGNIADGEEMTFVRSMQRFDQLFSLAAQTRMKGDALMGANLRMNGRHYQIIGYDQEGLQIKMPNELTTYRVELSALNDPQLPVAIYSAEETLVANDEVKFAQKVERYKRASWGFVGATFKVGDQLFHISSVTADGFKVLIKKEGGFFPATPFAFRDLDQLDPPLTIQFPDNQQLYFGEELQDIDRFEAMLKSKLDKPEELFHDVAAYQTYLHTHPSRDPSFTKEVPGVTNRCSAIIKKLLPRVRKRISGLKTEYEKTKTLEALKQLLLAQIAVAKYDQKRGDKTTSDIRVVIELLEDQQKAELLASSPTIYQFANDQHML